MDIEINNTKQQAQFKNGKYYQLFTPTGPNDKVKLYHMGCVGDTRLTHIQLEQGNRPTTFVEPKQKANSLSGIFQKLRDINVLMKDSDSEFWTRIKQNARGTIEEYHNNTLKNEITKTAEGVFEKQTKTINTNIDEKIKTAKTAIDKTITAETKKFADELSSKITTVQNESGKKNEVSVTENGVRIGSTELIDGRKLTSIITTQPENIKAITDRMIITPANENLAKIEFRNEVTFNRRDLFLNKIHDSNKAGDEYYFNVEANKISGSNGFKDLNAMIHVKYKDGSDDWLSTSLYPANGTGVKNCVATIRIPERNKEIDFIEPMLQQNTWNDYTTYAVNNIKVYKKKSAELIVDGSIEGRHVKANTLETGHHKAGSITSDIIAANAVKVKHIDINDALIRELVAHKAFINQLWAQQAFINNLKTVNFDFTKGTGSYIQSKNGGMKWDLDSNKLIMNQGSTIEYNTTGNALVFENRLNTSSGISFNTDTDNKATVIVGGSNGSIYYPNDDEFSGLKVFAGSRTTTLSGNSVIIGWDVYKVDKDSNQDRSRMMVIDQNGVSIDAGGNQGLFVNTGGPGYVIDNIPFQFQTLHDAINKLIKAIRAVGHGEQNYSLPSPFPEKKKKE